MQVPGLPSCILLSTGKFFVCPRGTWFSSNITRLQLFELGDSGDAKTIALAPTRVLKNPLVKFSVPSTTSIWLQICVKEMEGMTSIRRKMPTTYCQP